MRGIKHLIIGIWIACAVVLVIVSIVIISIIRRKRRQQLSKFPNQNQLQTNFIAIPPQVMINYPAGLAAQQQGLPTRNCHSYYYGV